MTQNVLGGSVKIPCHKEYRHFLHSRNTMKYVSDKDRRPFCADLKTIRQIATEEKALDAISPIFKFSTAIREVIYTTYTDKKTIPTFPGILTATGDFGEMSV